ncbi:AMP-binding protein [soil metagenome]
MILLESDKKLGAVLPNLGEMLKRNAEKFAERNAFGEIKNGVFVFKSWEKLYSDVKKTSAGIRKIGFRKNDKMIVFSPNRYEMLVLELAIMAGGGISVPIFAFFHKEAANALIQHSGAKFIAVAGELQLNRIDLSNTANHIIVFDSITDPQFPGLIQFEDILNSNETEEPDLSLTNENICLNMYTSGTMGIPKCVQLTHGNILSQQAALALEWDLNENDRFLSYLPWHHSFGGIFERFSALYNGATLALDSGSGKDMKVLFANWKQIQPTTFFSVPKVYQSLNQITRLDNEAEQLFYHSGLKFIFTAAASLPQNLSEEFSKRGVIVREGWGLTETSPCCTLTDPNIVREKGVVGKPIAGVSIRIADDSEIQVKGPNVMKGYFHNDEANAKAFTDDGWFCTGDLGELTPAGLKLNSRKDRIFKLVNGEKVVPSDVEMVLQTKCHYISYAMVVGNGQEYPVALIFPNKNMFSHPEFLISPEEGCFCPRSIEELGKCLRGCLGQANCLVSEKFSRIKAAMIIDDELSIEKNTLTPSMKLAPNKVFTTYKAHVENLYGGENGLDEEVYVVRLDNEVVKERN